MTPAISVIIPSFNSERFIGRTIDSVLAQRDVDLELIVVDDGSTDGSRACVEQYASRDARVRVLPQANAGMAPARNAGYRVRSPAVPYVLFLDSDDVLRPGALASLQAMLDADESLAAAFGQCIQIDEADRELEAATGEVVVYDATDRGVREIRNVTRIGFWNIVPMTPISTPGQCLLRTAALGDPVFDPELSVCADWDLWLRIGRDSPIGVEGSVVLGYRQHTANASKGYGGMRAEREEVYRKHFALATAAERPRFRKAFRFGMYGFDASLCLDWARQAATRGEWASAIRVAMRSLRYRALLARAALRNEL